MGVVLFSVVSVCGCVCVFGIVFSCACLWVCVCVFGIVFSIVCLWVCVWFWMLAGAVLVFHWRRFGLRGPFSTFIGAVLAMGRFGRFPSISASFTKVK